MLENILNNISWLGHASFKIRQDVIIYIDPWKISNTEVADIILITHSHFDHFSPKDIRKVQDNNTVIIAPGDCAIEQGETISLKHGDSISVKGVNVEAVPAYNIHKDFHPRDKQWVGYNIDIAGVKVYHAGDTDFIPEMERLHTHIALLPVGGTYTMDIDDAIKAAQSIKPDIVIPMHYGDIVGTKEAGNIFAQSYPGKTRVLSPI
jgi:L-ascorbate metabolism protein UlaG (beta-lactamase superfamily)